MTAAAAQVLVFIIFKIYAVLAPVSPKHVQKTGRCVAVAKTREMRSGKTGVHATDCPTPTARESPMTNNRNGLVTDEDDVGVSIWPESFLLVDSGGGLDASGSVSATTTP